MSVDVSSWTKIGASSNADFYEIEPRILAVLPFEGAIDSARTARESVEVQLEYLRSTGIRAGIVVFMDRVIEQDSGARAVYRDAPDPTFQECFALVGGTPFGRAVGSLFIGLSPPKVPTKMFGTLDEATRWIRERLAPK
jgi:hypothetical protein